MGEEVRRGGGGQMWAQHARSLFFRVNGETTLLQANGRGFSKAHSSRGLENGPQACGWRGETSWQALALT